MIDPYASCPCGSGKKFKWCCAGIHESIEKALEQFRNGQHEMALHTLDEVIKAHPRNPEPWGRKAQLLHASGRIEEAEQAIDEAFTINPSYPFGFLLRGIFREDEGEAEGAAMLYRKAVELYAADAHEQLSFLYERIGQFELERNHFLAARYAFGQCLRLMPENQELRDAYDRTFGASSHAPAVARQELRLLGYEPKRPPEWNEAVSKGNSGRLSEAVRYFENVVKQRKADPWAWYNAGLLRAWLGDNARALEHWEQYIEKERDEAKAVPVAALMQVLAMGQDVLERTDYVHYSVGGRIRDLNAISRLIQGWIRESRFVPLHYDPPSATITGFILQESTGLVGAAAPSALPAVATLTIIRDQLRFASSQRDTLERLVQEFRTLAGEMSVALEETPSRRPARFSDVNLETMLFPTSGEFTIDYPSRLREHVMHFFEEVWLNRPTQALGGLSPRQAAEQTAFRRRLLGLIQFREELLAFSRPKAKREDSSSDEPIYDFSRLRQLLHLDTEPPPPAIDFTSMSAADLAELDLDTLSGEQLERAFRMAVNLDARPLARKFVDAILSRPADPQRPDLYPFYKYLIDQAQTQADWEQALRFVEAGLRADAERNQGLRRNDYEVRRAQLLAKKGDAEKAAQTFQEVIDRVPNEPKYRGTAAEAMLSLRQGKRALNFAEGGLEVARKVGNRDLEAYFKELVSAAQRIA